jgi:ABC-type phosphate/phosphonate transport system substrate-binding protein
MKTAIYIMTIAASALASTTSSHAQPTPPTVPTKITIGIFAPSVEFDRAQARLGYAQGLAKAIESNTGIKTEAQSYASLAALKKDDVDFAIVDGLCVATNPGWKLLANAQIGGGSSRPWALYSGTGVDMQSLKGKKLAFVQMGCNDAAFVDNAMLDSEVDANFFSARIGKGDLTAAVAEVASYKGAQAVFAPIGAQKGLTRVFETGAVPNPGFVLLSSKVPAATADKVGSAVVAYGGGGAIASWSAPSRAPFSALAGQMGKNVKQPAFATPDPVRFDSKDVLLELTTLKDTGLTEIRQHFARPTGRME